MGKCHTISSNDLASSEEAWPQNEESSLDKEEDDQEEIELLTWPRMD